MKNRGQILIGVFLILAGLFYTAGILFKINLHGIFWPVVLIFLGLWLLIRPKISRDSQDEYHIFGDVIRSGRWKAENETFWLLLGDVKLDLSEVELPEGETVIRSYALLGDMKVIADENFPLSVSAAGILGDVNLWGKKQDHFLSTREMQTPAFANASKKLRIESTALIGSLKVK